MAITLVRAGFTDFTIFEKADDIGGTWRDNTYPGLTCDLPARIYQFSFAPNPGWSHFFAPGPEIKSYFDSLVENYGLVDHLKFGTEVRAAEFDGTRWTVISADGSAAEFDFLICATGILHHPRTPQLPGLAEFGGAVFHSARWNHDIELASSRVGVLGTGSTGVQLVTTLAGKTKQVTAFQRTAQWILPTPNFRFPRWSARLRKRVPMLDRISYLLTRSICEFFFDAAVTPGWRRAGAALVCRAHLLRVRDRTLRAALTPDYVPMCKRIVMSSGFYRAVQRPDVSVVTSAIDHIERRGIVTTDGVLHELDVLVLATGFDARAYMRPMQITGTAGRTLDDEWQDGPRAFETLTVPGFPNLFLLIGPHSPIGNFPFTAIAEAQAGHILRWLNRWQAGEFATIEPTRAATDRFNDDIRRAMPRTVWATGCSSWYLAADGTPELWPWSSRRHRALMLRRPDPNNYLVSVEEPDDNLVP